MALRTPLSVTPHLYMGDSTGRPLDMGTVYFGEPDKDPEFYPIELFSDDALTLPLMQPVHTKGGYLYDKGDMVEPHAKELIYSVKVLDSYGRKVFYKGAMMRNSWNDDVIQHINAALVSTAEEAAQIATSVAKEIADKAVTSSGFITIDSFELGATISQRNQALRHTADGKLYRWAGNLPKVVPASSTPTSSGGLGDNAWLEVSDTALRQELTGSGGSRFIGNISITLRSVAEMRSASWLMEGMRVKTVAYLEGRSTGANEYVIRAETEALDDGGSIIKIPSLGLEAVGLFPNNRADITQFGADDKSTADSAPAINACSVYAAANKVLMTAPAADFYISSQVVMRAHFEGSGYYREGTQFLSRVATGASVVTAKSYQRIENLMVVSLVVDAKYDKSIIGIEFGESDPTVFRNRYQYKNLWARGFGTGIKVVGFIGVGINIWADGCGTGFFGDRLNSSDFTVNTEKCIIGAEILDCTASRIKILAEDEGGPETTHGIIVNGGSGMVIDSPYLEYHTCPNLVSALSIGESKKVSGIVVKGGSISAYSSHQFEKAALVIDDVDGYDISITVESAGSGGSRVSPVYISSKAKNCLRLDVLNQTNKGGLTVQSRTPLFTQYVPDPLLEAGTAQFSDVTRNNATISKSSNTLGQGTALRIQADSAALSYASFRLNKLLSTLKGKTVNLGAWIYIPDYGVGKEKIIPYITAEDGIKKTPANYENKSGSWNFLTVRDFTVDMAATKIDLRVHVGYYDGQSIGTEYVILDSLFIWDNYGSEYKILSGEFHQSTLMGHIEGANFIGYGEPATEYELIQYNIGDTFRAIDPLASGYLGKICVAAGEPKTAVFKEYGKDVFAPDPAPVV